MMEDDEIAWIESDHWGYLHKTMIYTAQQTQQLADEMVEREEKATKKELTEEEKERLWNLIKSSVEGG